MTQLSVPLLDLKEQYRAIREEIREAMDRVCDAQAFILGKEVEDFEKACAKYCRTKYAVGVSSGTDALIIALLAAGVKAGDEVITSPYTFFATASSIARIGARPVFVDIEEKSFNIDPSAIAKKITTKTKAIMPVHLYGQAAQMDEINDLAGKHNLKIIEDACQAIGAEYRGKRSGSLGDFGCFSFFPSKNLGGFGDAGLVTTNSEADYKLLKALRMHGEVERYHHAYLGGNFRIDALQAAVLRVKLQYLDKWAMKRAQNAQLYRELFNEQGIVVRSNDLDKGSNGVVLPEIVVAGRHVYNQYIIRAQHRNDLLKYLQAQQIGCNIYYPLCLHEQQCFQYLGDKKGDYPVGEKAAQQSLALPIYPELTAEQIKHVVNAITAFYREK
ncbi:MAG: DegT/DnrJ/EryC1/StrS family aminotransferase [Deltaproteobacteria bacterium]|nr:DegT/DnrJ/EryC1/StrS family aminotransferase [Deltaproteobacteria bacterium]